MSAFAAWPFVKIFHEPNIYFVKLHVHVAGCVSVMTIIFSITVKMAAPVTELHFSKAPRTRKVCVMRGKIA